MYEEREYGEPPENRARGIYSTQTVVEDPQQGISDSQYKLPDGTLIDITISNFDELLGQDPAVIADIAYRQISKRIASIGDVVQSTNGQYFKLVYEMGYQWKLLSSPHQLGLGAPTEPRRVVPPADSEVKLRQKPLWAEFETTDKEG